VKAFVSGASGFLGRHIVKRLRAENVWVRTLVRYSTTTPVAADDVLEGDLRDPATLERAVQGVDMVFHAGARVATNGSWEEFEATNVTATDRLIQGAVAAKVKRIVHVSSLSVFAVPFDGAVITEDSPYEAGAGERGFYARSKLAADEVACRAMAAGAPVTVVRPGLLFGPGRGSAWETPCPGSSRSSAIRRSPWRVREDGAPHRADAGAVARPPWTWSRPRARSRFRTCSRTPAA
jgi:nucleoside-diphosphate-sugar epimerase